MKHRKSGEREAYQPNEYGGRRESMRLNPPMHAASPYRRPPRRADGLSIKRPGHCRRT